MADPTSATASFAISVAFKDGGKPTQWPLTASTSDITPVASYTFKTIPLSQPLPAPVAGATGAPPVRTATGISVTIDNVDKLVFLALSCSTPPSDGLQIVAYNIVATPPPAAPPAPPAPPAPGAAAPPAAPPAPAPAPAAPAPVTVAGASVAERRTNAGTANLLLMPGNGDVYVGAAVRWLAQALKAGGNQIIVLNIDDGPNTLDIFAGYSA